MNGGKWLYSFFYIVWSYHHDIFTLSNSRIALIYPHFSSLAAMDFCCTCALPLSDIKVPYSPETEKPLTFTRTLDCCGRTICASCQYENPRFETYCPFCQISSETGGALPQAGLKLPPAYEERDAAQDGRHSSPTSGSPPPYSAATSGPGPEPETSESSSLDTRVDDVIHHLAADETLQSLALLYRVPTSVLRNHNTIYSDHLLSARKIVCIPRSHYQGPSLSHPPNAEEEEKKTKLRRWMVATKCADYNVARLYLKGSDWNLEVAVEAFKSDEQWEKNHPFDKGKGSRRQMGLTGASSLNGQLG